MLAEEGDDISNVEVPAEEEKSPAPPAKSSEKPASSSSSPTSAKESSPPPKESKETKETKSDEKAPASKHAPHTSKPMMPSVMRLLTESNVSDKDAESIKGTGVRGMLTKGDVLVFLGKAKGPTGTFTADNRGVSALGAPPSSGKGGDQAKKSTVSSSSDRLSRSEYHNVSFFCQPLTPSEVRSMILSGLASSSHASRSRQVAAAVASPIAFEKSAFDELLDDYEFQSESPMIPTSSTSSASKDPFQGLL